MAEASKFELQLKNSREKHLSLALMDWHLSMLMHGLHGYFLFLPNCLGRDS